jgi:hypothetical protein
LTDTSSDHNDEIFQLDEWSAIMDTYP